MNFISAENEYNLDLLDTQNDMICIWINSNYYVFKYKGKVKFFQDGNGVGESWIDYEDDIKLEFVPTLSDVNDVEYERKWIVEIIATEEFKQYCAQYDEV